MRLCFRLAALVLLLVLMAIGLVYVRTAVVRESNELHRLYRAKHDLEKDCYRLELAIANLRNPQRMREAAVSLKAQPPEDPGIDDRPGKEPLVAGKARPTRP
jgi:cell division protein FtsL